MSLGQQAKLCRGTQRVPSSLGLEVTSCLGELILCLLDRHSLGKWHSKGSRWKSEVVKDVFNDRKFLSVAYRP